MINMNYINIFLFSLVVICEKGHGFDSIKTNVKRSSNDSIFLPKLQPNKIDLTRPNIAISTLNESLEDDIKDRCKQSLAKVILTKSQVDNNSNDSYSAQDDQDNEKNIEPGILARYIITAPKRCPPGFRVDAMKKCRKLL